MRERVRRPVFVMFVAMAIALMSGPALAQEGTPVDQSPNPEECTHEPRTVEELQAIHGTPAPAGAGEATSIAQATPVAFELPAGEAPDAETAAAITTVVRIGIACFNAGDYLAGFGGVTEEFLVDQVGLALFDQDFVASMNADPVVLPEDQHTLLIGIDEMIVMADGRVAAVVHYVGVSNPGEGIDGVETDLWIYENVEGMWLLDESIQNIEGTHGPDDLGTPAA